MYVELDKETSELVVQLPEKVKSYFNELNKDILNEFSFELINKDTLQKIDQYIKDWFFNRGVELPKEKNENENTD